MFPTLDTLIAGAPPLDTHSVFAMLGLAVAGVLFWWESRRRGVKDPRIAWLVIGALIGASLMARLGTWLQHLDLSQNLSFTDQLIQGNASILSGLVGAWLGVHIAKKIVGYKERTGDLFAPAVCLALVIGRIGCYLTEKPGTPTGAGWGITLDEATAARLDSPAGVGLHPSFVYEIVFHLICFCLLLFWLRRSRIAPGEMLTVYIGAYAIFRFLVEFVRGNDVAWMGLTRPQLFLIATIPIFIVRLVHLHRNDRLIITKEDADVPAAERR